MRALLIATLTTSAVLALAMPAKAGGPNQLVANASASVSGGCACGQQDDKTSPSATVLSSYAQDLGGGAYGHASVTTEYGEQHVYADAFFPTGDPSPDVQSQGYSEYDENFAAGSVLPGLHKLIFKITGSMSIPPAFGPGPNAYLNWDLEDITHPGTLTFGTWVAGTNPSPIIAQYFLPSADALWLRVDFVASAYAGVLNPSTKVFADYSHTAHTYITSTAGDPDVIGTSGHDYAQPIGPAVPEPASWAMLILGFGIVGTGMRRPRPVVV